MSQEREKPQSVTSSDFLFRSRIGIENHQTLVPDDLKPLIEVYIARRRELIETDPEIQPLVLLAHQSFLEIEQYQQTIDANPQIEPDINLLATRKKIVSKPEPLPTKLRPAVGRLTRAIMNVFVWELPRPDIEKIDKDIKRQKSKQPQVDKTELQIASENLEDARLLSNDAKEQILSLLDQRFCQNPKDTLVHLYQNPDRTNTIFNIYCQRASENLTEEESFWYAIWISREARQYTMRNNAYHPRTLNWFRETLGINSPEMVTQFITEYKKAIDIFEDTNWTYVSQIQIDPTDIKQIAGNVNKPKKARSVKAELQTFNLWALKKSASTLGIIMTQKNGLFIPESISCPPPKEEATKRREQRQEILVPPVKKVEEKSSALTIAVEKDQLNIESLQDISPQNIARIFNMDRNDQRIQIYIELISTLWTRINHDSLNIRGIESIQSESVRGKWGGQHKWKKDGRLGDYEMVLSIEGQNGIRTITIKAIGTHEEIFMQSNH